MRRVREEMQGQIEELRVDLLDRDKQIEKLTIQLTNVYFSPLSSSPLSLDPLSH